MHMEKGIGRTGYLLLALVIFCVGAFGFVLAWSAFQADARGFFIMGLGVAATAMIGLWAFATFAPWTDARPAEPTPTEPAPTAPPARLVPAVPAAPAPASSVDYEFPEYEPAATAAPERVVIPQAFQERPPAPMGGGPVAFEHVSEDPANWPGNKGTSTWTRQQQHRQKVQSEVDGSARRHELTDRYTRTTPTLRAILDDGPSARPAPAATPVQKTAPANRPQEHIADRAPGEMNTDFVAPGMSVGQCGQCSTLLLAPETRPLRLKCPECAKVTLLE